MTSLDEAYYGGMCGDGFTTFNQVQQQQQQASASPNKWKKIREKIYRWWKKLWPCSAINCGASESPRMYYKKDERFVDNARFHL